MVGGFTPVPCSQGGPQGELYEPLMPVGTLHSLAVGPEVHAFFKNRKMLRNCSSYMEFAAPSHFGGDYVCIRPEDANKMMIDEVLSSRQTDHPFWTTGI